MPVRLHVRSTRGRTLACMPARLTARPSTCLHMHERAGRCMHAQTRARKDTQMPVSYTHLRAHETSAHL
eukprot:1357460-Alexandrium_andersonii.AAC.1